MKTYICLTDDMNHQILIQGYSIFLDDNLERLSSSFDFNHYSQVVILVDENTRAYCLPQLQKVVPRPDDALILEIPAGETIKGINTCKQLWQSLLEQEVERNALFINLGGGVIGDMGGFVASTYKRGIDFVNFPTTLLSQVDATIGGKLGFNFAGVKNSIGLFANPKAVFIYPQFLKTLPSEELTSGYAEMIKHVLISRQDDWGKLRQVHPLEMDNWEELILSSLKIKANVVEEDPYEKGIRKALNFGHTIGHALESYSLKQDRELLHGHAVALGMIGEAYLSQQISGLTLDSFKEIFDYLKHLYGQYFDKDADIDKLLALMRNDKKNQDNRINFTLLSNIGQVEIDQLIDEEQIKSVLEYMKANL